MRSQIRQERQEEKNDQLAEDQKGWELLGGGGQKRATT